MVLVASLRRAMPCLQAGVLAMPNHLLAAALAAATVGTAAALALHHLATIATTAIAMVIL